MSKNASALKVKLSSYDELFGAANAPADCKCGIR